MRFMVLFYSFLMNDFGVCQCGIDLRKENALYYFLICFRITIIIML